MTQTTNPVPLSKLLLREYPEAEQYWGPFLTSGSLNMIFAQKGIGKTFLALRIAAAIASGTKFLDYDAPKPRRVLYLDGEMGAGAIKRRMLGILTGEESLLGSMDGDAMQFVSVEDFPNSGRVPNLSDPEAQEFYDKIIKQSRADVFVVDNLLTCTDDIGTRDHDVSKWRRVEQWAIKKRREGLCIIFIHHSGKSGDQLGTSTRETVLDFVAALRPVPYKHFPWNGAEFFFSPKYTRHFGGIDALPRWVGCQFDHACGDLMWSVKDRIEYLVSAGLKLRESGHKINDIISILDLQRGEAAVVSKLIGDAALHFEKKRYGYDDDAF